MTVTGWVPDPAHDFGARLALVRQHHAWNMRAAATACGVNPESWRAWETQGRRPQDYARVCQAISERAGCSVIWLMTGQTPHTSPGDGVTAPSRDTGQNPATFLRAA